VCGTDSKIWLVCVWKGEKFGEKTEFLKINGNMVIFIGMQKLKFL
jgi:hypothetical protein